MEIAAWSASNEKLLASGARDIKVRIWNTDTSDCVELVGHEYEVDSIAYSRDGITLVSASDDHTCRLWDAANGTRLQIFSTTTRVRRIVFSPNDVTSFATIGDDLTIRVWHGYTGSCLREITGTSIAEDPELDFVLAYSPDGTCLACGLLDNDTRKITRCENR